MHLAQRAYFVGFPNSVTRNYYIMCCREGFESTHSLMLLALESHEPRFGRMKETFFRVP